MSKFKNRKENIKKTTFYVYMKMSKQQDKKQEKEEETTSDLGFLKVYGLRWNGHMRWST